MKARMEKYTTSNEVKTRTNRNNKLYDEISNMNIDYVNIDVNNAIDMGINSGSKREDFQRMRELNKIMPVREEKKEIITDEVVPKENRIYDINEILNLARKNKLFEYENKKRLINTEYNILTKLDIQSLENEDMKKEDIKALIDDIYEKEKKPHVDDEKDLFSDLVEKRSIKEEKEEQLVREIKNEEDKNEKEGEDKANNYEEKEEPLDKHESNQEIVKDDEEQELVKEKKEEKEMATDMSDFIEDKSGKGLMIAIIVVTILIILAIGFFAYEYFFGV